MLDREEDILNNLVGRFGFLKDKGFIARERRIFLEVPKEEFMEVISYAANSLKFDYLCTITGLDAGDDLQFIYHIANAEGVVLNLKIKVPKSDPVVRTVTGTFNGAVFYERELEGLLGAKVEGLPKGRHYPLPDNWPEGQYPLRKDWKPEMISRSE